MKNNSQWIWAWIVVLMMMACAMTNETDALRALEAQGMSNVKFHGHAWGRCGQDATCTEFTATNPLGKRVSGAVGCGYEGGCDYTKACTVRW